jgi:hypothetical protein
VYDATGPPVDIADQISSSFPNLMMVPIGQLHVKAIAELDK